ncbi:MAG: hypothetical protein ACPG45_03705 [Flavobacteriaceae bacterium]
MKITALIFSLFVLTSCCANKETVKSDNITENKMEADRLKLKTDALQESPIVIYGSHTRGYHFTLTVYNSYATISKEYNGTPKKIEVKHEDIIEIKDIISKLTLKDISSYEAPTKKRFYDGAPHTTISVFSSNEKFTSQTFDGGFPPKPLADLVNKVLSLSPEK